MSLMDTTSWEAVDSYFVDHLVPDAPDLDAAVRDSDAAGLPSIQVAPNQGMLLHLLLRMHGGTSVLEIGTLGGYSTIWLARALPPEGRLVTLELNETHAAVAQANLERAGVADRVEVRVGPAADSLAALADEAAGPFDFIFIDADKRSIPAYFEWSLRLARPGTVILVDNVVRRGAVLDAESDDPDVQGVRRFIEMLGAEGRVQATAVQTVGTKGYDGFALAVVRS